MRNYLIAAVSFLVVITLAGCSKMPVKPGTGKNKATQGAVMANKENFSSESSDKAGKSQDVLKNTGNAIRNLFSGFKQKKNGKHQPFTLTPKVYVKILTGTALVLAAGLLFLQFRPR